MRTRITVAAVGLAWLGLRLTACGYDYDALKGTAAGQGGNGPGTGSGGIAVQAGTGGATESGRGGEMASGAGAAGLGAAGEPALDGRGGQAGSTPSPTSAGGTGGGTGGGQAGSTPSPTGAGGTGGGTGGQGSTGGASGAGGATGTGGYSCPIGGTLDCSSAGALKLPGGLVTDFSASQWNGTTSQWCDADGLRGHSFSFIGTNTSSSSSATVDPTARNLKLAVTSKDWAGGGLIFESCVNASSFSSVQFTASLASGSLTGCTWQVQLQTQDQRASTDIDPGGGTCASNCYGYPAVGNLATPAATGTTYSETFTQFNNPSNSTVATATEVVGIQWQVTSSSSSGCTAELRIDNIKFQ